MNCGSRVNVASCNMDCFLIACCAPYWSCSKHARFSGPWLPRALKTRLSGKHFCVSSKSCELTIPKHPAAARTFKQAGSERRERVCTFVTTHNHCGKRDKTRVRSRDAKFESSVCFSSFFARCSQRQSASDFLFALLLLLQQTHSKEVARSQRVPERPSLNVARVGKQQKRGSRAAQSLRQHSRRYLWRRRRNGDGNEKPKSKARMPIALAAAPQPPPLPQSSRAVSLFSPSLGVVVAAATAAVPYYLFSTNINKIHSKRAP